MPRPLKILSHHIFYPPEYLGVAVYSGEMCEWLASRGHDVRVVCPPPYYPHWAVQQPYSGWRYVAESLGAVQITRCPIWLPSQPGGISRALYAASFALSSFPALLREIFRRPDVIFVTEPSFLNAVASLLAAKLCGALSWMHVQDFELDIAFDMGQFRSSGLRRFVSSLESCVMRRFDVVSTISGRMMDRLEAKGVVEQRRVLFPNWIDTESVFPMEQPSPLRRELAIPAEAFVALYSGSLGRKQGIELLVDAARLLLDRPMIRIVICGDGVGLPKLREMARNLPNVQFVPSQLPERRNDLFNMADIHLLPQRPSVADLVMPSKLLGMLASGRPVVATAHHGSEVASVVAECGIVVPPEDPAALANAITALSENEQERIRLGAKARGYAAQNFHRDAILAAFETRLCSASM